MKFPEWKVPADISRAILLEEAQFLLKRYESGRQSYNHICPNCTYLWLRQLLAVVRASLPDPSKTLEVNMGLPNIYKRKPALRIAWLKQLEDMLLNQHPEKE